MNQNYTFDPRKMLEVYQNNSHFRLKHLHAFANRLRTKHILGEQNAEYRKELEWVLECTIRTIQEVKDEIYMDGTHDI